MSLVLGVVLAVCGAIAGVCAGLLYRRVSRSALQEHLDKRKHPSVASSSHSHSHSQVKAVQMKSFQQYSPVPRR